MGARIEEGSLFEQVLATLSVNVHCAEQPTERRQPARLKVFESDQTLGVVVACCFLTHQTTLQ